MAFLLLLAPKSASVPVLLLMALNINSGFYFVHQGHWSLLSVGSNKPEKETQIVLHFFIFA
jgi:hypothetical protein